MLMPEPVRYRNKKAYPGTGMLQYRNEMMNAEMPMPSYDCSAIFVQTGQIWMHIECCGLLISHTCRHFDFYTYVHLQGGAWEYGYKTAELVKPHCMRGAIRNHQVVAFLPLSGRNVKFLLPQKKISQVVFFTFLLLDSLES